MTRRKRDTIIFAGLVLGSIAFLFWVIPANMPAYPGYGVPASLLPNVTVSIVLLLSVIELLRNLLAYRAEKIKKAASSEEVPAREKVHLLHLILFMVPCVLLMPAMRWLGFIPAGVAFMLIIQFLCGQRRPVPLILVTVGTVGLLYAAMRYGLQVPMP